MKKLVKKNKIPKGQWGLLATAPIWGPYVIGALGTAAAGAAAYPYIKNIVGALDLNDVDWGKVRDFVSFNPHFTTGRQLIEPELTALNNSGHLYTGLGEGIPMREVVVTPEVTDYTMLWNPVTGLSKGWKKVKKWWKEGQTETATPEPEKPKEENDEEEKHEENEKKKGNSDNSFKLRTLGNWAKNAVKYGPGAWGGFSGAERLRRGIGYGLQDDIPFWEGFWEGAYDDSSDWMMLPALKNITGGFFKGSTKSRYEEYRKEHPIEEEEKEEDKKKNTFRGTTATEPGKPRLKLE